LGGRHSKAIFTREARPRRCKASNAGKKEYLDMNRWIGDFFQKRSLGGGTSKKRKKSQKKSRRGLEANAEPERNKRAN